MIRLKLLFGLLALQLVTADSKPIRIRELVALEGARDNQLLGYGLVVGLNGTGDKRQTFFSSQSLASLLDRRPIRIAHPPYDIVVVSVDDVVFALEDACNHSSASLAEGFVRKDCLICPAHGFAFALATGELVDPPGRCDDQRRPLVRPGALGCDNAVRRRNRLRIPRRCPSRADNLKG